MFVLIHVPLHALAALPAIQQLQLYAIVFQIMLASNQYVVEEAKLISLRCYESLLWTKKQLAIFLSVEGRSPRLQVTYAQQDSRMAALSQIRILTICNVLLHKCAHKYVKNGENLNTALDIR
jgi:hypothetical protein